MNALKYLINLLFLPCALLLWQPAQAQILTVGVDDSALSLPEGFLSSLEQCLPYNGEKPLRRDNVAANTLFLIDGMQDGLCGLHITGITNSSVEIHQDCALPADVAKAYAHALQRFIDKNYSPRWHKQYIKKDSNYQAALKIMSDTKYCKFYRKEIDNTENIRKNLPACRAAQQTEITSGMEISRQIIGLKNGLCEYRFTAQKTDEIDHVMLKNVPPTTQSKFSDDVYLSYTCALTEKQSEYYLLILESETVPAEEGYDYAAIWHISQREELDFLRENCVFKVKR